MNLPSATLLVSVNNQVVCIKINGRATFTSSLDLKKLINELWERGLSRFIFDLSECMTMDSTFLGVLSGIGLKFAGDKKNSDGHTIELLNPNPRIAEVLENLGVAHLFKICSDAPPVADEFQPLSPSQEVDRADVTRTCLEAHNTLMEINPNNVCKFKDVAAFLAEDLKKIEAEKTKE